MGKRDLLKTTSAIGVTEIMLMIVSVARNKYLAVSIGPEGLGIYGLLTSFSGLMAVFVGSWLVHGTIKYIAEYRAGSDKRVVNGVFTFSIALAACLAILMTLVLIIGRNWILPRFFSSEIREIHYVIFVIGFAGLALRPLLLGVLQAMKRVRQVVIARSIIALSGLALIFVFVYRFKLTGLFLSMTISSILAMLVLGYFIYSGKDGIKIGWLTTSHPVIYRLLGFGGMSLIFAFINLGSQFYQRKLIVQNIDLMTVGLFQAGIGLMAYLRVLQKGAAFKFLPDMSVSLRPPERRKKTDDYFFVTLLLNIPVLVGTILFAAPLITILYSQEFAGLERLLFWFVLATYFGMISTGFQIVLMGMAKLKRHLTSLLFIHGLWVLLPYLFINQYGLKAVLFGLVAGNSIGLIINYLFLKKELGHVFNQRTAKVFFIGLLFMILAQRLIESLLISKVFVLVFMFISFVLLLTSSERLTIKNLITKFLRFKNS